jgi:hypothetical protein
MGVSSHPAGEGSQELKELASADIFLQTSPPYLVNLRQANLAAAWGCCPASLPESLVWARGHPVGGAQEEYRAVLTSRSQPATRTYCYDLESPVLRPLRRGMQHWHWSCASDEGGQDRLGTVEGYCAGRRQFWERETPAC